jgi:hypothetical protein
VAKPLTIRIDGLDSTFAKLNDQVDDIKFQIDNEMAAAVENMATSAKQNLSADYGALRASISARKLSNYNYLLSANKDYAPYIEFGTGIYAASYLNSKEKEWQDLARQYYVNGKGTTPSQPYFYPAVKQWTASLLNRIKTILNKNERL